MPTVTIDFSALAGVNFTPAVTGVSATVAQFLNTFTATPISISTTDAGDYSLTSIGVFPGGNTVWRLFNGTTSAVSATLSGYDFPFTTTLTLPADTNTFLRSTVGGTHILTVSTNSYTKAAGTQQINLGAPPSPSGQTTIAPLLNTDSYFITGSGSADTLSGSNQADTLVGGNGNDSLTGGAGVDTFNVAAGTDTISDLGNGVDILLVAAGATANATAVAAWTATASTSNSGTASVTASGFNINVNLATVTSGWTLTNSGNATAVTLTGGGQADTLIGGTGADTLVGNAGADSLTGGNGNDSLVGGTGNDTLIGGAGTDTLIGAAGNDTFVFTNQDSDSITSFSVSASINGPDVFAITSSAYTGAPVPGAAVVSTAAVAANAANSIVVDTSTAITGLMANKSNIRFAYATDTRQFLYDTDSDWSTPNTLIATTTNTLIGLTAANFAFI